MRVMTEEPASETLLKASAMTATEAARSPAVSFPANRRRFKTIPVTPARRAYLPRTAGSAVLSASLTNSLTRSPVMMSAPDQVRSASSLPP